MLLTKWTPRRNFRTIWDTFDNDFFPMQRFFDDESENFRRPLTNINETDKSYLLTMEMPGVSKENVEVSLEGDKLTISGERVSKLEEEGSLRKEIREEKFSRSFVLDGKIEHDHIKARMENGILTITLPKKEEEVGRRISID